MDGGNSNQWAREIDIVTSQWVREIEIVLLGIRKIKFRMVSCIAWYPLCSSKLMIGENMWDY